jgi:hypothetical protein
MSLTARGHQRSVNILFAIFLSPNFSFRKQSARGGQAAVKFKQRWSGQAKQGGKS